MKWMLLFAVCISLICATAAAQGQQQAEIRFNTASILPASILQTETYKIADTVSVDNHQFQFIVETRYGTLPVTGIPMLEKRISELRAIEQAGKISSQRIVVNSAWETLCLLYTSPSPRDS